MVVLRQGLVKLDADVLRAAPDQPASPRRTAARRQQERELGGRLLRLLERQPRTHFRNVDDRAEPWRLTVARIEPCRQVNGSALITTLVDPQKVLRMHRNALLLFLIQV